MCSTRSLWGKMNTWECLPQYLVHSKHLVSVSFIIVGGGGTFTVIINLPIVIFIFFTKKQLLFIFKMYLFYFKYSCSAMLY